jgi:uncharacterized repeat protein (TIGR01451 family)
MRRLVGLLPVVAVVVAACHMNMGSRGVRPPADLEPGWTWSSAALPTGDVATSVITVENMAPRDLEPDSDWEQVVRVTNISSGRLDDVVVSDYVPSRGYTLLEAEPEAGRDGDMLRWRLGTLDAGESRTTRVVGHVDQYATRVSGCATVTYSIPTPPKPYKPPPPPPPPAPVLVAKLELSKSMPADTCIYETIPIRIVVRNSGNGKASAVKVTDQLPEGWTVDGRPSVSFDLGDLAPGATKQLSANAKASRPGRFTNTATLTSAGCPTIEASASTDVWKAAIGITQTASLESTITSGDVTYTITVTNTGDRPARDCAVRDALTGADVIRATSEGGVVAGSTITWKLGDLAPGASKTVTVRAAKHAPGTIESAASATAMCADSVNAAARTAIRGIPAVLLEVVDDPDPVPVSGTTTYTIAVVNQGTAPATGIAVVADLEDSVAFVSASGPTKETASGGKVAFGALGSLEPKATARWTIVVRGVKPADSRIHVAVTTKETERPIEETEATRIY